MVTCTHVQTHTHHHHAQNKKVVVFYGSQTGTAEEFATRLSKEATRHGLPATTFDPEECTDWEDLAKMSNEIENSLAIFCVATYGEGDPTDNAQEFHNWLKETEVDLSGLKYVRNVCMQRESLCKCVCVYTSVCVGSFL